MEEKTQRVIKADNIKIDGPVKLGLNTAGGSPRPAVSVSGAGSAGAVIVEKNSQFMTVEVTCTCGKKTYLKCEFA
jgi:hypothetical protein